MKYYENEREYTRRHRRLTALIALAMIAAFLLSSLDSFTPVIAETASAYRQVVRVADGDRTLSVEATADADVLPEDATLVVQPVSKDDAASQTTYQNIQQKLTDTVAADDRELVGFAAYDIHFEENGQKVEPNGNVSLTMNWSHALTADGADNDAEVSVQHLEGSDANDAANANVVDLTKNAQNAGNAASSDNALTDGATGDAGEAVNTATVETEKNTSAVNQAKMTVDGFSVFTITWTKENSTSTSFAHSVSGSTDDGNYSVTVNYNDDAKIPEGTTLSVKPIEENSTEYKEAKNAVVESKKNDEDFDEDKLGMSALDISLVNGDTEVEPQSDVQVQIQMNQAPDEAEGLEVQHIQSEEKGIINKKKVTTAETVAGGEAEGKIENKDGGVTAEFKTPSFSIYTITWKKSSEDNTRVGSIRVHYVNDTGADMANAASVPSNDLVAGNEVTLADWANDAQGKTRLTGYTFKEARLETYQSDKKVSKIKVVAGTEKNTYVLQYQPEGSSDWITYTDSVSKQHENNVEVYLIFTQNPTLKLHYVDENGTDLNGGTTDSIAADEILNDGISVSTWSSSKTFTGYTPRDNSMAHLGGINGSEVTDVRSVKNADGSFTMQYKAGTSDTWKALTSNDIYLEYSKASFTKEVDIYYSDIAGIPIKDASGKEIVKKIDAADWNNGTHNFVTDATSYTPEGYANFSTATNTNDSGNYFNQNDHPYWWRSDDSTSNNAGNRIVYITNNYINNSSNKSTFGIESFRYLRGYAIDTMIFNATDNSVEIQRARNAGIYNNSPVALPSSEDAVPKVYIMYRPKIIVHDIDSNGNELGTRVLDSALVGYDPQGWNSTFNASQLPANPSYGTRTSIYVKNGDSEIADNSKYNNSTESNNFEIAWQFSGAAAYSDINTTTRDKTYGLIKAGTTGKSDGTGKWITRIHTGNGSSASDYTTVEGSLITDVYMKYDYSAKTVTVHHIDSDGKQIAKDSTETISTDKTITPSISTDYAIDGYTLAGGKVDMTVGSSAGTVTGGTGFYSYTVGKSGNTLASTYKTSTEASNASPANQNEIWLVYAKNKIVTIHYIDTNGGKLQNDTTKTVSGANTIITPSTDADTITNFDRSYGKIEMVKGSNGNVSGGTQFFSICFKPNQDGTWGSTYKAENGGSDTDVSVPNELWYVYTPNTNGQVIIHFVDTDGNVIGDPYVPKDRKIQQYDNSDWHGADFLTWLKITESPGYQQINKSEYSFKGEYIGPSFNTDANKLVRNTTTAKVWVQWKYDNGNWYTSHSTSGEGTDHPAVDKTKFNGLITDFYWVFDKTEMNVHYVYMDLSSDETNTKLTKIKDDQTINSVGTSVDDATTIDAGNNDNTSLVPLTIPSDNKSYQYAGTRIGPSFVANTTAYGDLGPDAKKVYSADGQLMYYNSSTVSLNYLRKNTWYADTNSGRRYTLTGSGNTDQYNYALNDSSHGDVVLNYVSPDTYTASFHGENGTTQYKLTINNNIYELAVTDWQPSGFTDVYEIYTQGTQNKIWIEDDQKYSGYLIANISSALQQEGTASNKTYTWYKTITNSSGVTTTSQVSRKLTGQHYNIEYNPANRTWLNVEADEGGLNDTDQTSVQYYVELNYTDNKGKAQTLRSNTIDIQYYSQLENGGFETPVEYIVSEPKTSNGHNGYNGSQNTAAGFGKAPGGNGQISNADYKAAGGVWQTTGTGPDTTDRAGHSRLNRDLEIFNVNMGNTGVADSWATSSKSGNKVKPTAADGVQFAELNCEAAGALYQDVVTHPNEQLHYRFSHRARATSGAKQVFDSMYLVIMPTKLAMTGSSTGGELKTQSELEAWLKDHGGYDDHKATAEEEKITYQDFDNGVLVVKVSSDNYDWHSINVVNGYTPKGGLTRFFFVAGQTSNGNKTTGNFIDGISFSQELPPTKGINLQVNKTFSGLSDLQLASLAGNASTTPFTFTVSNRHYDRKQGNYDSFVNAALQNATLGFDVSGSADSITFTPTATLNGVDQFTGNSEGDVTRNADGSITMTWTFLDLPLRNTDGTIGTDQDYYYKVTENNSGITGYSVTPSESIRVRKKDGTTNNGISSTEEADLSQGDSATFNVDNSYKDNSITNQPQIVVTKKFTGVTPSSVDEMLGSGYRLKVTNTSNNTLILQGNTATPVVRSAEDPEEIQNLDVSLTMDTVDTSKDGSITLTWLIKGWGAGTYTMEEEGFNTSNNSLSKITVNDESVDISSKPTRIRKEGLVLGGASATSLEYGDVKRESAAAGGSLTTPSENNQPAENTNLIIAQYTLNDQKRYVVWTPETLGANTSQAVINKINSLWTDANASMSNTDFHSSANPGTIEVKSSDELFGSLTYDSTSHHITFAQAAGKTSLTWNNYCSTIYHVSGQNSVYNEPDIRVVNSYEPAVRVLKVSSGENATPLKGAKFRLYTYNEVDGKQTQQYLVKNGSTPGWGTSGNAITFETNEAGIAVSDASNNDVMQVTADLKQGTYYLEETTAPPGYNMPSQNVIAIKVGADGIVTQVTDTSTLTEPNEAEKSKINTSTEGNHAVTIDWNSSYYTITVRNEPGVLLPITGGIGVWPFIFTGFALIMFASYLLWRRRRSKLVEEKLMDEIRRGGDRYLSLPNRSGSMAQTCDVNAEDL